MRYFENHANGKNLAIVGIAFLLSYLFLNVIKHPFSILSIKELTGGYTILNVLPFYNAETAYEFLNAYPKEAIKIYRRILVYDLLILIPVYVSFFSFALIYLGNSLKGRGKDMARIMVFLPLIAGTLNIIEDGIIFVLLNALPTELNTLASLSGIITTTKSILITVCFLSVITIFLIITTRAITKKRSISNFKQPEPN